MKAICVDNDIIHLGFISKLCDESNCITSFDAFEHSEEALKYIGENRVDLAILDVELLGIDGIELGMKLKETYPQIMLAYMSDSMECLARAIEVKADYYLLKPAEAKEVERMLERMELLYKYQTKNLYAQMLGRFEMYYKGEVMHFSNAKAKELLALCLDHRGGEVSMEEAIDKLWPNRVYDDKVKKLYRKASICLNQVLHSYGINDFYVKNRASSYVDSTLVDCDYYTYLSQEHEGGYEGEYLFDYEWSEETLAKLVWPA